MLNVSILVSRGKSAVVVSENGKIVNKSITNVAKGTQPYSNLITAFGVSLRLVRSFIDNNPDTEDVVFEFNNSAFIKWVKEGYSKEQYQDEFIGVLSLLNEIPIKYTLVYSKKPMASYYLNTETTDKVKLSGLLDD